MCCICHFLEWYQNSLMCLTTTVRHGCRTIWQRCYVTKSLISSPSAENCWPATEKRQQPCWFQGEWIGWLLFCGSSENRLGSGCLGGCLSFLYVGVCIVVTLCSVCIKCFFSLLLPSIHVEEKEVYWLCEAKVFFYENYFNINFTLLSFLLLYHCSGFPKYLPYCYAKQQKKK